MPFPIPNTVCDWWAPGSPLDPFATDDESVLQQLKPLVPFNDFQDGRYPPLIYRFAVTPTIKIIAEDLVGSYFGVPGSKWIALYEVLGSQAVNRSPAIPHYHYVICRFRGWLDEFSIVHGDPLA